MPSTRPDVLKEAPVQMRTVLDETGAIFPYNMNDLEGIDPNGRITLARLAMRIGDTLHQQSLPGLESSTALKPDLGVTMADRKRAGAPSIERGLYIYADDPRYADADLIIQNRFFAGVSEVATKGVVLPFPANYRHQPAVVFKEADYHKIPRNPKALVRAIRSTNRVYNAANTNMAETTRRSKSAAGQAMAGYVLNVKDLLHEGARDRKIINRLQRQVPEANPHKQNTPQNQFLAKNLVAQMTRFNGMLYDTVETAAINNGWSRPETHGVHLAHISKLYLGDSPKETSDAWRNRLGLQENYTNARYFKLIQALRECQTYEQYYRPFMREVFEQRQAASQPSIEIERAAAA